MAKIAFLDNKMIWAGGDNVPRFLDSKGELQTGVVIATYEDTFDPKYEYSYEEIDGKFYAKQGDLVAVDPVEEKRILDEIQAVKYKEDRKSEYPSYGDQLDALYHAGVFPDSLASKIKAVKDKYPKPKGI